MNKINRIHHVSSIVGDPQENYDFYTDVLGLRLIKQTVNFDDPSVYHFYFADEELTPGFVMTTFPWAGARPGRVGSGQVGRIAFRIPKNTSKEWKKHLEDHNVVVEESQLFQRKTLEFEDIHGLDLALVESDEEAEDASIRAFHGLVLLSAHPNESVEAFENVIDAEKLETDEYGHHYKTNAAEPQHFVINKEKMKQGRWGPGTTHHMAWEVSERSDLKDIQEKLGELDLRRTEIKNRDYFESVYMREPGYITIEFATKGPGFTVDEPEDKLGQKLQLPDALTATRAEVETSLPPLEL
jgi:glyoxalase family protein